MPGPFHFVSILDSCMMVDMYLQWLGVGIFSDYKSNEKKIYIGKIVGHPGDAASGAHHFVRILDRALTIHVNKFTIAKEGISSNSRNLKKTLNFHDGDL